MPAASSVGAAQQQWYDVSILEVARIARVRTNERTDKGTFTFDQKLQTRHATLFGLMAPEIRQKFTHFQTTLQESSASSPKSQPLQPDT
ncbi:hypothetical protein QC764_0052930 [Podospora pseudoanserina]|uniref:Uncharacterized protein n=1 Tax=Podospora pseudoanserina TaxID=2609844 RepID=A0ABR0ICS8_9PEZI|nr:hypothetical protein QC764_0052930 [Podospora pseudoanserina]